MSQNTLAMIDNYERTPEGIVRQVNVEPISYDKSYVENSYVRYGEATNYMSHLRLGNIIGTLGFVPESILDVGYGNGSFLEASSKIIPNCYGHDISTYPIPPKCKFVEDITSGSFEVITFFDSLEHFEDIDFVKDLKCDFACITVPNCHYIDDEWFLNWKHRRPDEHLWHFNEESLVRFMNLRGFYLLTSSNIEDTIRKNPNQKEDNILTCIFGRR
jgi:hypothetical protein